MSRPTSEQIEDWAVEIAVRHLEERGESVRVRSRPDKDSRNTRAPDCELEVDGRTVALEVTTLWPAARDDATADHLEGKIRGACLPRIEETGAGWVILDLVVVEGPRKSQLDEIAEELSAALLRQVEVARIGEWCALMDLPLEARVLRYASAPDQLSVLKATRSAGRHIDGIADRWVTELVSKKSSQASDYGEVWLLVVDNSILIEAEDLASAFARHGGLPDDWRRVLFLPPGRRERVADFFLGNERPTHSGSGLGA